MEKDRVCVYRAFAHLLACCLGPPGAPIAWRPSVKWSVKRVQRWVGAKEDGMGMARKCQYWTTKGVTGSQCCC